MTLDEINKTLAKVLTDISGKTNYQRHHLYIIAHSRYQIKCEI